MVVKCSAHRVEERIDEGVESLRDRLTVHTALQVARNQASYRLRQVAEQEGTQVRLGDTVFVRQDDLLQVECAVRDRTRRSDTLLSGGATSFSSQTGAVLSNRHR